MITRSRFGSKPDIPHSPDVYEILESHDNSIRELKGLAEENKLDNATILKEVRDIKATDRHATTKLIAGLVATVVTTVGGVVGTLAAMRPGAAQAPVVVQRSALDIKMDKCRAMPPVSQTECFVRTASGGEP